MSGRIRVLVVGILRRPDGRFLFDRGYDRVKKELFYRPLGGAVEFGETAAEALVREFQEEIGRTIRVGRRLGMMENHFEFESTPGHELVVAYEVEFVNPRDEDFQELPIVENGRLLSHAVWRSLEEIRKEEAPVYPEEGMMGLLEDAEHPQPGVSHLSYLFIHCHDLQRMTDFYRKIPGLGIFASQTGEFTFFRGSRSSGSALALYPGRSEGQAASHVLIALDVVDLPRTRENLISMGIQPGPVMDVPGGLACFFQDPEGNRLELHQPVDGNR